MAKDTKHRKGETVTEGQPEQGEPFGPKMNRRDFFTSLGTWSKIVIGGILLAGQPPFPSEALAFLRPPPEQPAQPAPGPVPPGQISTEGAVLRRHATGETFGITWPARHLLGRNLPAIGGTFGTTWPARHLPGRNLLVTGGTFGTTWPARRRPSRNLPATGGTFGTTPAEPLSVTASKMSLVYHADSR